MWSKSERSSFGKRTSIFLILMLIISSTGFALMSLSQQNLTDTGVKMRGILLPADELVENARREIDLQIHELSLLDSFNPAQQQSSTLSNQQRALLRLSPSVQALISFYQSPREQEDDRSFDALFTPWIQSVENYQRSIPNFETFEEAGSELMRLSEKTLLLKRGIDREFRLQILKLEEGSQAYLFYFSLVWLLAFLASAIFAKLVSRWTSPLATMNEFLKSTQSSETTRALPSYASSGFNSLPREISNLTETLREHEMFFEQQQHQLAQREEKLNESDRSLVTLFAAVSHLLRHNQELIDELVKKERLASMSEVAAQLAHEIRNPLNSMSLKLELIREELDEHYATQIDPILAEIDRLDALTESHLSQTRGNLKHAWPLLLSNSDHCQPVETLKEVQELLKESLSAKTISFEIDAQGLASSLEVAMPQSVLKSVFINLIKNSIEAIEAKGLNEEEARIQVKVLRSTQSASSKTEWVFEVSDTGCGVPKEFYSQPIEAFRTSKSSGSGLGLATSEKMIAAYGGSIRLGSAVSPFATQWVIRIEDLSTRTPRTRNESEIVDTESSANSLADNAQAIANEGESR